MDVNLLCPPTLRQKEISRRTFKLPCSQTMQRRQPQAILISPSCLICVGVVYGVSNTAKLGLVHRAMTVSRGHSLMSIPLLALHTPNYPGMKITFPQVLNTSS